MTDTTTRRCGAPKFDESSSLNEDPTITNADPARRPLCPDPAMVAACISASTRGTTGIDPGTGLRTGPVGWEQAHRWAHGFIFIFSDRFSEVRCPPP